MHFPAVFKFVRQLQYYVKAHQTHITLIKPLHPLKSKPLLVYTGHPVTTLCDTPLSTNLQSSCTQDTPIWANLYTYISVIVTVVQVFL